MVSKAETAEKFTAVSRGWSQREYRDPASFMERRAALVQRWGPALQPGDRILELGCGDGTLSCFLAGQGFDVTGVDISPGMIAEARQQAAAQRVSVKFELADGDTFKVTEPYDAIVSFMSAFFTYLDDPAKFVEGALPFVRKKLILDWNFRSPGSFLDAGQMMQRAGLQQIEWRPWLVPHTAVGAWPAGLRGWIEQRPNLSLLALILKRWHYTVYLKGERPGANTNGANHPVPGNRLPDSFIQRSLIKFGQLTRSAS
jgi:SAM-dependent methyltransferase